jgi:ElaB/YqjD/DUF883 family membrane-anchored ribosome-binding protein
MSTSPNPPSSTSTTYGSRPTNLEDKGRELGRRADQALGRAEGQADQAASRLSETGSQVKEKVVAAKDKVVHGVQNGRDKVTHQVQEHPMKTLLYAFGAGALVGMIVRRGRRHD